MTIRRFGIALAVLTFAYGCAEAGSIDDNKVGAGGTSTSGGKSGDAGSTNATTGGTTGTLASGTAAKGGSTTTVSTGGSSTTTASTSVTPTSCGTTSGELAVVHAAQTGGSGFTGTTTVTPGSLTSFNADAVKLKICFYTIGDVPAALATSTDAMKIYNADIGGMPAYTGLTAATISTETVGTSQFCFVIDFGSVAAATGIAVSGTGKVNCNWNFDTSKVSGLSLDTREGHKPQVIVLYNDVVAACLAL